MAGRSRFESVRQSHLSALLRLAAIVVLCCCGGMLQLLSLVVAMLFVLVTVFVVLGRCMFLYLIVYFVCGCWKFKICCGMLRHVVVVAFAVHFSMLSHASLSSRCSLLSDSI